MLLIMRRSRNRSPAAAGQPEIEREQEAAIPSSGRAAYGASGPHPNPLPREWSRGLGASGPHPNPLPRERGPFIGRCWAVPPLIWGRSGRIKPTFSSRPGEPLRTNEPAGEIDLEAQAREGGQDEDPPDLVLAAGLGGEEPRRSGGPGRARMRAASLRPAWRPRPVRAGSCRTRGRRRRPRRRRSRRAGRGASRR